MNDSYRQKSPKTQDAAAGGPPTPPKKTARGSEDQPPDGPTIEIPDPVVVTNLAAALTKKPFQIIAELMELGQFSNVHDTVPFEIASKIAWKYGVYAKRAA